MRFFLPIALVATINSQSAFALTSPIGISFVPPIEFPLPSGKVMGFRLNLARGTHDTVYGLDFGFMNETTKEFIGSQIGFMNMNAGQQVIIRGQIGFFSNVNNGHTNVFGVQAAVVNNKNVDGLVVGGQLAFLGNITWSRIIGVQLALINSAKEVYGLQVGLANDVKPTGGKSTEYKLVGAQVGFYNHASNVYGFQVGVINSAMSLHGIQIGLLNFNDDGPLHFFPLVNVGF